MDEPKESESEMAAVEFFAPLRVLRRKDDSSLCGSEHTSLSLEVHSVVESLYTQSSHGSSSNGKINY
jgi:hypothetical protein